MNFFLKQQQSFVKKYCVLILWSLITKFKSKFFGKKNAQRDIAHKLQYYSHNNTLLPMVIYLFIQN